MFLNRNRNHGFAYLIQSIACCTQWEQCKPLLLGDQLSHGFEHDTGKLLWTGLLFSVHSGSSKILSKITGRTGLFINVLCRKWKLQTVAVLKTGFFLFFFYWGIHLQYIIRKHIQFPYLHFWNNRQLIQWNRRFSVSTSYTLLYSLTLRNDMQKNNNP